MERLFDDLNVVFEDPAYSDVRDEILASASEKDLELEPRPPVTLRSSRLEDVYDVHHEIGKGKFGVVRKVTERSSQQLYAAKYISPSARGSGSSREDIMHEINIMNQLHHKRLVGLVDAFDIPGKIVMIMEFVSGGELFERVADADCLTEKEASFYMYQLLQGLEYMHSKSIVHLDLKPENIVCVSKDSWDIKLIDFGLAQELVPGVRIKALKGTPEFMAPEAVNFEAISLATDMWSVGVIAYILLSGLSPLLGENDNETLANVTAAEWDFDDESFDVISDQAKDFISKLLVKNARKRDTVTQSLEHHWMQRSASVNAVKIDTMKLKQFLVKRRWQKSVNAVMAVRRLSSLKSYTNVKTGPSVVPSLATVPSDKEEECEERGTSEERTKERKQSQQEWMQDVAQDEDRALEATFKAEETENEGNEIDRSIAESVESEEDEEESEESEDEDVLVPKDVIEIRSGDVHKFYCIEEEVGRGRFGIVKKCVELDTTRRFCAKFIRSRPTQKKEFKREIDVMNALRHPRLIRLYDAFEEPRQIILIMEYARGGDLSDRIDEDSLPEVEAVKILKQVLEGIKFMHDNGFMHLDLKPQNVMFKNEDGSKIKLIDFSLARKFDPDQETNISFGTAEYVAPEIVNYEPVTPAADMWAIGVVAYMMLSGESPFLAESEAETFRRITDGRWEFSDVFDYVSKEAKDFITRLLMKEPRKRMTAEECLEHDWIKSPGFTGEKKSKRLSENDLVLEDYSIPVSPTERKRQESKKFEGKEMAQDEQKLESQVKELLSKLQHADKENKLLQHKLRGEEERADALEDELRTSQASRKELDENVSRLETEKISLHQQAKSHTDVLRKMVDAAGEKKALEDELLEKSKNFETITQKYESLKEKVDHYEVLEEKIYLLEREKTEYQERNKDLEDQLGHLRKEREELVQINKKNAMVNKNLEFKVIKMKEDSNKFENEYNVLRGEKEALLQELTKRSEVLDEQKTSLAEEKSTLAAKLNALERENNDFKLRLENAAKENARTDDLEKEKDELEKELNETKKQREETQETCEDLALKLSKALAELEEAKITVDNDRTPVIVNQREENATLHEKVSLLERDRQNLEDDLDDKEAEVDKMEKKIEQLETENMKTSNDLLNYQEKLKAANEEMMALQTKLEEQINPGEHDEDSTKSEYGQRIKDYESVIEKLTKEVSSLQGRLSAANQKNKDLEEKVTYTKQASYDHAVVEKVCATVKEEQLQRASVVSNECSSLRMEPLTGDEETNGEMASEEEVRNSSENEKNNELKNDLEKLKLSTEELESKLTKEREKTRSLEGQIENFEVEKREEINMSRELEEECNRLREELKDIRSSQKEVEDRLQQRLNKRLQDKEEEIGALNKKVDSLRKEVQTITEEKDKGDILFDRLAEKHKNLLKESKILEQEKQQCEELEESMQSQIRDFLKVKDEIESMRDNVRTLVHEKELVMKEYSLLQKDLVKLTGERQQLEERIRAEIQRADKLEKERSLLQGRVTEMRKELDMRDLVASADKKTINTHLDEIKTLKDGKLNAVTETETLRNERKKLLQDLERLNKERRDADTLKLENEIASKKAEKLENENQQLLQRLVEFDQMKENCENLRDELQRINKDKQESLIGFQNGKEEASQLIETLRQENGKLVQKIEEMGHQMEYLEKVEEERAIREDQVKRLDEENEKTICKLKENLRFLKNEKRDAVKRAEILKGENERLLKTVNESIKIGEDYDKLKVSFKKAPRTTEDVRDLKTENLNLRKEAGTLRDESEKLVLKVRQFDNIKEELAKLKHERVVGEEEVRNLKEENEGLLQKVREMEDMKKTVLDLRSEKEIATEEIENLKKVNKTLLKEQDQSSQKNLNFRNLLIEKDSLLKENETLRNEVEILNHNAKIKGIEENFSALRVDKENLVREVERLNEKNENLLQEFEQLNSRTLQWETEKTALTNKVETLERTKEELIVLKEEKEKDVFEIENLKQERNTLLDKLGVMQRIKENLNTDLKVKRSLQEKIESLEIQLENQALETMKFKKESAVSKKKIDAITKGLQRLQDEQFLQEEQMAVSRKTDEEKIDLLTKNLQGLQKGKTSPHGKDHSVAKNVGDKSERETRLVKSLKEEIGFLEKEVEDLSEENRELLQKYKGLQKEHGFLKEELNSIEGRLEMMANDLQSVTSQRDVLEKGKNELEYELQGRLKELQELRADFDPVKGRLEHAEKEIKDLSKENEELHQNYINLEEKYDRIRKINRELEEDVDIESNNVAEAKRRIEEITKINANLQQRITKMQQEISKLRGISGVSDEDHGKAKWKDQRVGQNKTIVQSRREQLEAKLIEEELSSGKIGDERRKLNHQYRTQSMDNLLENQTTISSLKREVKSLRASEKRVEVLEKDLQELKEKLDLAIQNGNSKAEEINVRKKENDSLIYELESTRHRLVSNVLNPLQETTILGSLRVSAADISAGKSKAWTTVKGNITKLIRECVKLTAENINLQQECSRMKEERPAQKSSESNSLVVESNGSPQKQEKIESNRKPPTAEDIVDTEKDLQALQEKIAQGEENLELVQGKSKELLRGIEFMKRMRLTDDKEKQTQKDQRFLSSSLDGRLGRSVRSEFKAQRSHAVESTAIIDGSGEIEEEPKDPCHDLLDSDLVCEKTDKGQEIVTFEASGVDAKETHWPEKGHDGDRTEQERMQVARELVKKNKQIFELEQEVDALLKKIEELSPREMTIQRQSTDAEDYRLEILRLERENKSLKELTNDESLASSTKKMETLEAMNNFLRSEKDELVLQIAAKNKKIEILERREKEMIDRKTNVMNETKNGVCNEADDHINDLDEELRKTKHTVSELEAELEHAKNSYNSKLKREVEETEAKWTKRLRKECTDLQAELSEKHNKEKLQWQKKEVELQNIIRQMKLLMNKKLGEAEHERRKLEQQLMTSRSSSFHGSTVSLDSNSDDSEGNPPSNTGATSSAEIPQNDSGLSDRELRRVAYKLNGEEWSQLGTFLGVGDRDLLQLGGLTMGPQEKAFRLLCIWRTRCRLIRSQMISQLAVSLEEVNRKDVAQFVLEQFMSGKPRKKLFGW